MTKTFLIISVACASTVPSFAGQAPTFQLARFGSLPVSDAEVAQIADVVRSTGKRPWLLRTPQSMIPGVQYASLFLEPDLVGRRVQRGRMIRLVADEPPAAERSPWRIQGSYSYAYIPTSGHQPGDIRSERDINWPFHVEGELDDDTLISIVQFIRTQPRVPMPAFLRQVPAWPIYGIARRDDGIQVGFQRTEATGDTVWLAKKNGRWVITRSASSVV
jgi:hypothetical protein